MMETDHISVEQIKQLLSGALDEVATQPMLRHLLECETCLQRIDEEWKGEPWEALPTLTPKIDTATSTRIERKLRKQINRSNLSGTIIRFATQGFLEVARVILRSLLGFVSSAPKRRKS